MTALSKKTRNMGGSKQQSNHNSVTSISFPSKHLKAKKVGIAYETAMFTGRLNIDKYLDIQKNSAHVIEPNKVVQIDFSKVY